MVRRLLFIVLAFTMLLPVSTAGALAGDAHDLFPDVDASSWFYPYASALVAEGVISGYPDGTFRPEGELSYAEALKLILLAAGYAEREAKEGEHWAQGYLDYADGQGFAEGEQITSLDASITRHEIAAIAARALTLNAPEAVGIFADTDDAHAHALFEAGILEGSFDESGARLYKGGDRITRAEISAVIYRIYRYVEENLILFSGRRIPIDESLGRHEYDLSALRWSGGRIEYGGDIETLTGIDVSYYQGDIDWRAVAADGIDFAMLRAGFRGYGEGTLNEDECFAANIKGALSAGVPVGIYFFSQAVTAEEALEEAEFVLSLIEGHDVSWPVVFDWETVSGRDWRTENVSQEQLAECARAFCDAVEDAGYTPMIYMNKTLAYLHYDLHAVADYDLWLADYYRDREHVTDYIYDFAMWQYTSSGSVNGISGRVDMNIAFKDYGG